MNDPQWQFICFESEIRDAEKKDAERIKQDLIREWNLKTLAERHIVLQTMLQVKQIGVELQKTMRILQTFKEESNSDDATAVSQLKIFERCDILITATIRQFESYLSALMELAKVYQAQYSPVVCIRWVNVQVEFCNANIAVLRPDLSRIREQMAQIVEKQKRVVDQRNRGGWQSPRTIEDTFRQEPPHQEKYPGEWRLGWVIPSGQAVAGLWVQYDPAGTRILDRFVMKKAYLNADLWLSTDIWYGDPRDVNTRCPQEFFLQKGCALASPDHFVDIRAWSQNHRDFILTLFVEYCPHLDLWSLKKEYEGKYDRWFPEPFLYMLFLQLVEGCKVMWEGGEWHGGEGKQIVHRDLKPENIFLDTPNPSFFPQYPTAKMADFGNAIRTSIDDPLNPKVYNRDVGTRQYWAPEQRQYFDPITNQPVDEWKLLGHTNIYGIGAVLYDLVTFNPLTEMDFTDERTKWQMGFIARGRYSEELLALIERCVEWDPIARPTFEELGRELRRQIKGKGFEWICKMNGHDQSVGREWELEVKEDVYKIAMASG